MSDYRAYIFGMDGHRFIKADKFLSDHPDDTAAMKAAERLADRHDVELWDSGRLVARFAHRQVVSGDQTTALLKFASERIERVVEVESRELA
jgi:hypothetical protein